MPALHEQLWQLYMYISVTCVCAQSGSKYNKNAGEKPDVQGLTGAGRVYERVCQERGKFFHKCSEVSKAVSL